MAEVLPCSRSDRSSLDVALEQVSKPLSVGLEMEEATLSEVGRVIPEEPCSMNGTPERATRETWFMVIHGKHESSYNKHVLLYINLPFISLYNNNRFKYC